MSTLRVDSIENNDTAVNFPYDLFVNNGRVEREYYSQTSRPTSANNGAVWWNADTSMIKIYIKGAWYPVTQVTP